ncbi:VOC family protein [Novosphingobium sp.]|uniref:VOC family protein n=1 Tax=Novosphingobium sp. TaxID=1874826 RepID=UPI0035B4D0FA
MKLRLRQIALAVADLEAATSQASQVLGLGPAYQDPAIVRYGLRNAVYAIGNTFLEFVSPITENTTVGRLLAKQGGDCGYMVILQTDAADEARARIDAAGVRVADQLDRNGAGFMHLHPKDVGGTLLSVDYMPRWSDWEWGGPDWQSCATHGEAITGVGIDALDPQAMAGRWGGILGRPMDPVDQVTRIHLDEGELRFEPLAGGGSEGFHTFDLHSARAAQLRANAARHGCLTAEGNIELFGMTIRLV